MQGQIRIIHPGWPFSWQRCILTPSFDLDLVGVRYHNLKYYYFTIVEGTPNSHRVIVALSTSKLSGIRILTMELAQSAISEMADEVSQAIQDKLNKIAKTLPI